MKKSKFFTRDTWPALLQEKMALEQTILEIQQRGVSQDPELALTDAISRCPLPDHDRMVPEILGNYIAAMEGAEAAYPTASGVSAIVCAVMQICKAGDHIVSSGTICNTTFALFSELLHDYGIEVTFVDPTQASTFEEALQSNTRLFYGETLSPTLKVMNIAAVAKIAKANSVVTVIDNRPTPMIVSPHKLGADIVIQSGTTVLSDKSNISVGVISGTESFINEVMDQHKGRVMLFGPTLDAGVAHAFCQQLPDLAQRIRNYGKGAEVAVRLLEELDVSVMYPGLESHPQHGFFNDMINPGYGLGGKLIVDCGDACTAWEFVERLAELEFAHSCSWSSVSPMALKETELEIGLTQDLVSLSICGNESLENELEKLEYAAHEVGLSGDVTTRLHQ